jgi:hypothetical protein
MNLGFLGFWDLRSWSWWMISAKQLSLMEMSVGLECIFFFDLFKKIYCKIIVDAYN